MWNVIFSWTTVSFITNCFFDCKFIYLIFFVCSLSFSIHKKKNNTRLWLKHKQCETTWKGCSCRIDNNLPSSKSLKFMALYSLYWRIGVSRLWFDLVKNLFGYRTKLKGLAPLSCSTWSKEVRVRFYSIVEINRIQTKDDWLHSCHTICPTVFVH